MGSGCAKLAPNSLYSSPGYRRVSDLISLSKVGCGGGASTDYEQNDKLPEVTQTYHAGPSWKEMLAEAAKAELWPPEVPRYKRSEWRKYMREGRKLLKQPRMEMSKEHIWRILIGDLDVEKELLLPTSSKILVFLSSTFTDTMAERNQLMKDVFPFLRDFCRALGLDFSTVDMRWGVKEEVTREHGTVDVCLREVHRCCLESCGPAFLALLGNKYGYRPLPVRIEKSEFEKLTRILKQQGEHIKDLQNCYLLDDNNIPPIYVLKPKDPSISNDEWYNTSTEIQRKIKMAANDLPRGARDKYFISVTEQEIMEGFIANKKREKQTLMVFRHLRGIANGHHANRRLIDMAEGEVDEDAQTYLLHLKKDKIQRNITRCLEENLIDVEYDDNEGRASKHVRSTCERVCKVLVSMILKTYKEDLHRRRTPVIEEIIQNMRFLKDKSRSIMGRDHFLKKIIDRVLSEIGAVKSLLALHGTSGVGKTAFMALLAKCLKTEYAKEINLVVRFIGTTRSSGTGYNLLISIVTHIVMLYDRDVSEIPVDYHDLIVFFRWCLSLSSTDNPLVIFLDSIEQIYDKESGENLKWLSLQETIPEHTHIIVSTTPGDCLNVLRSHLPKASMFEISYLRRESASLVLKASLESRDRRITEEQEDILMRAYELNPFPLYMKMLVDKALTWRSYDVITPDKIAAGVAGMTSLLFERLETRYGNILVHHALGYITAAKNGLSETELEDILSCDDEVLDEVFDFWLPPIRRIPPSLWIRIRSDLHLYLMEKGSDGGNVYSWYHKQCKEMASTRYLHKNDPFTKQAHQNIADYFDERWIQGKEWQPKEKSRTIEDLTPRVEDRRVSPQPLVVSGNQGKGWVFNKRKLMELPYNLRKSGNMERAEKVLSDLCFIEAKFESGQGYDYRNELIWASKSEGSSKLLKRLSKLVGSGMQHLMRDSSAIYQLIHQQPEHNLTRRLLQNIDVSSLPLEFIEEEHEQVQEDPCEMTLRGHTSAVRSSRYSPSGDLIASTGEDGSLRIWNARTGVENVTVLGLKGQIYSKMVDNHMVGYRPLAWERKGKYLFTGSETGDLQVFDVNGAEIKQSGDQSMSPHSKPISEMAASPKEDILVTCGKDYKVKIWSTSCLKEIKEIKSIQTERNQVWAGDFNLDGSEFVFIYNSIAADGVTVRSGLQIYKTSDWSVKASLEDVECKRRYCVKYSPGGDMIATGNDRNDIELWDIKTKIPDSLPKQHHAYVRGIAFNTTGSDVLVSCADDYMVMVWDLQSKRHLATVAGHMNRVCDVCFDPHGDFFVTCSRDTTLKLWDYDVIMGGSIPNIDGIPFVEVQVSPDRKYVMTVQGVNSFVRIYGRDKLKKEERIYKTPKQKYSIVSALWSGNGHNVFMLDAGNSGNFLEGSEVRARVTVCPVLHLDGSTDEQKLADMCRPTHLDVFSPSCMAVNSHFIAVGTYTRQIRVFKQENLGLLATIMWDSHHDGWGDKATGTQDGRKDRITSVDLHPSQNTVVASVSCTLKVWQISKGGKTNLLATIEATDGPILENKFSPNGQYLIYTTMTTIVITSAEKRHFESVHVISGHADLIHSIAMCPYSRHLATASQDGTVKIWKLGGNFQLRAVHYSTARRICFLDANLLLAGGGTGPLRKLTFTFESF